MKWLRKLNLLNRTIEIGNNHVLHWVDLVIVLIVIVAIKLIETIWVDALVFIIGFILYMFATGAIAFKECEEPEKLKDR